MADCCGEQFIGRWGGAASDEMVHRSERHRPQRRRSHDLLDTPTTGCQALTRSSGEMSLADTCLANDQNGLTCAQTIDNARLVRTQSVRRHLGQDYISPGTGFE